MVSTNYTLSAMLENHGSGSRNSTNYQITYDAIIKQPIGTSTSTNYSLIGLGIAPQSSDSPFCDIYINDDDIRTNTESVSLSLLCGAPSGCAEVSISNNGVSWSDPEAYATSKSWNLSSNDGTRNVFVKYKNGSGDWSGVCSDSIILDTTMPTTAASPVGGTFMSAQSVTLTINEPGTIYYTTDETVPTASSTVYTGPINLTADTVLKFFSADEVGNTGVISTEQYTICNGSNLSISGVVKDATLNKGIPLAVIKLSNGQQVIGDANGNYSFTGLARGYYRIDEVNVTAPGFVTYQKELELCKDSVVNDIILTTVSSVFGADSSSGYSSDSVNTSAGNYVYQMADLELPGRGIPFAFERSYNSQDETDGPLGFGWTHNYNITLTENVGTDSSIRWGDGKVETWIYNGVTSEYEPRYGVFSTLIKNGDGSITLKQKDMLEYRFDVSQKLASLVDENSNTITFTYIGDNLTTITDTVGRTISLTYDVSNRITLILGSAGRSATYTYDVNGDMVSSTDLGGNTTSYTYDANHQILTITDPLGNVETTIVYNDQRRVVSSQRDALGADILYSYDVVNKKTQIVDPNGNISYHYFDDLLRLIKEKDSAGNIATYVYDTRGNLQSVTDKNGNTTSYQYDSNGNVLVKTDPLGNQISATYDANNNPLTKTDANGNITQYAYDAKGNILTITNPLLNTITFTYDSYGQLSTDTDALGGVTTNQYDIYGNLVSITDALGNVSTFTYDLVGRKLTEVHPLGRAVAYEYDNMDQLISVTDALGGTSTMKYDANGNKIEHVDAKGNKTTFAYDAKNRLISKINPLNETESYTYDKLDRRTGVTNPRGYASTVVCDSLGNVIQEVDAQGNNVRHEYDANGNRVKTIDAKGHETTFVYDVLNRLISKTDPLGNTETYTYDANDNKLTVTDALGKTTTFTYDSMDRVKTVTDPLLNVTTNAYDELGRLVSVTNAKGNMTVFEYDALGRMVRVTDAASGIVTATYDSLGNRTSVTDTLGNTTTYTHDKLNRLTSETDPLGNSKVLAYDSVGNLTTVSDANGTASFAYDNANRILNITYPDMTTVAYTYDANGNRLTVIDIAGTTSYTYDSLDRIATVTDPFSMTVGYTYDPNSNRSSIKYPGNKSVYYYFDELNRLISVQDWGGITTSYEYDNAGRLSKKTMGNGSTVTFTYDDSGRLISKVDKKSDNTVIASYTYTLDEVGNRTGLDMTQPLVPELDKIDDAYSHNAGNQVASANTATYTYDGKGNRVTRTEGAQTTQYIYNFNDMLTKVDDGTDIYEYKYTSDGKRLESVINGTETRYLLDLNSGMENVLAETDNSNNVQTYYVYGDGLLYSVDGTTGERLFYHYDPLGNTVALTDSLENVTDKYAYLPFGELNRSETLHDNPYKYVGKFGVAQEPNGLLFMRARFYDPETRGFISKDRVKGKLSDSQSINPYIYVQNNPILMVDPEGEFAILTAILVGAVIIDKADQVWDTGKLISDLTKKKEVDIEGYMAGWAPGVGLYLGLEEGAKDAVMDEWEFNFNLAYQASYALQKTVDAVSNIFKNESTIAKYKNNNTDIDPLRLTKSVLDGVRIADIDTKEFVATKTETKIEQEQSSNKVRKSSMERWFERHPNKSMKAYKRKLKKDRKEDRERERARRKAEERRMYVQAAMTYSKYSVLIMDVTEKPVFKSDSVRRKGVYEGK